MKAIQVRQYGTPEVLQLVEMETPTPGSGEALVQISAIGVNFKDTRIRLGLYPATPVPLPFTPGVEASGIVASVGEGVTDVKVGDRVTYVFNESGAYAEAAVIPAERLIPLPDDVPFNIGVALTVQGLTAHYLLHEFREIKPGITMLIHGAAGGMGLFLIQWGKHLGARVIGTVSSEQKARVAHEAGADDVILYTKQDFVEETRRLTKNEGVNFIIDGVGKKTFAGDLEVVSRRGHVVLYGMASGEPDPIPPYSLLPSSRTVSGSDLYDYIAKREELLHRAKAVFDGFRQGWLQVRVDTPLPLAEAERAHTLLENRKTTGKLLLTTES